MTLRPEGLGHNRPHLVIADFPKLDLGLNFRIPPAPKVGLVTSLP
jgi:hypothetical protein